MLKGLLKALGAIVLVLVVGIALFLFGARFADGPIAIVAGGPFTSGETHQGTEPDWSFLKDRQEVEFQLLEPARSRTTWITEHEGRIFIPSGYMNTSWGKIWKQWPIEAEKDGRALLRVDGKVYERQLVRIHEGPELPFIASELRRKYMGQLVEETASDEEMEAAALAQIADGNLWVFELRPRT